MDLEKEIFKLQTSLMNRYEENENNIIYLRLSAMDSSIKDKDKQIKDTINKLKADYESLLKKYPNLGSEGYLLYIEVKSAYKNSSREMFDFICNKHLFNDIKSFNDIIEPKKSTIRLYISSFDRLSRVFFEHLVFQIIRKLKGIRIYSLIDEEKNFEESSNGVVNKDNNEQLMYVFRLMMFSSQASKHSEDLSNKVKKRVTKDKKGVTISSKTGNKWGGQKTITPKMESRIKERFDRFTAKEIIEQSDIYQIVKGVRKPISINTVFKIVREK